MWLALQLVAEERIQEAIRNGEFDTLEGMGKPLKLDDDPNVPPELRMAYKMLKNADCLPPEMTEKKEIQQARELLEALDDEQERYRQMQKLNALIAKANARRSRPVQLDEREAYFQQAVEKISVAKKDCPKS